MKKLNGFTIIAHRPYGLKNDGLVILGAKESRASASGYEYVTAVVATLDDREWYWGHYFTTLDDVTKDYDKR